MNLSARFLCHVACIEPNTIPSMVAAGLQHRKQIQLREYFEEEFTITYESWIHGWQITREKFYLGTLFSLLYLE